MRIDQAQQEGTVVLERAGINSPHLDATILLETVTGKSRSWLLAHGDDRLSDGASAYFYDLLERRRRRVPLVHLTNRREFYGLDLYVDDRVLTPRVETETMVDYVVSLAPVNSKVLDMGTGSGALALAIKTHRPDLDIWASDVSAEAIDVARMNADLLKQQIKLHTSDLFSDLPNGIMFDAVVANLPYLRDDAHSELMPEVQREPTVALFGGADGLDLYRHLFLQISNRLVEGGYVFTECDPWQHDVLISEGAEVGLKPLKQSDYFILGFQLQP